MFQNRFGAVARLAELGCVLAALTLAAATAARADGCPKPSDEIATDRPDVTNSSIVVPVGSLQNENGINLTGRSSGRSIDGSNSRWQLGIAPCLEVLIDLPNYVGTVNSPGTSGFSDVAPGIKWQISPVPGKLDLSITAGVALPTGAAEIAGRGAQPYIQLPWSWELHDGWGVSGMFTEFFRPAELTGRHVSEATFVIEKKLTERISVFTEYVGDYPDGERPTQFINSGGLYQITPTQQVDFHVAFGLNRNSPNYIVGLGYSFRVDGLFR
ncbi:transporter [Bradyrhizobium sp. BEA-2-5]|uniref:transporter n=1 Tax=Bradyrhizobium TaxID=374 RepID=UPI00067E4C66|nr:MULTISPECIES: transporter [Bradyrhizobium]WOH81448.1 transporter [Bradyrhizobium sp. BEA-2-5]